MGTSSCHPLMGSGAICPCAATAHPSFLSLQIAGVVIMAAGVAGLLLPRRRQQGWLRRRTILRRGPRGPVAGQVDETRLPPYVMLNPGASAHESNGAQPGDRTRRAAAGHTLPASPPAGPTTRTH